MPGESPDVCGKLRVSMYGTRDAAANWESCYSDWLMALGFVKATSNGCIFYHQKYGIRIVVHGDDFLTAGPTSALKWLEKEMSNKFEAKHQYLGESSWMSKEIRVLNRDIKWTKNGIAVEADRKHVENLLKETGLTNARGVNTPAVREQAPEVGGEEGAQVTGLRKIWEDAEHADHRGQDKYSDFNEVGTDGKFKDDIQKKEDVKAEGESLSPKEQSWYRRCTAIANYLAQDRPGIQWATRHCSKDMSSPTLDSVGKLKRLARYLKHRPTIMALYPHQQTPRVVRAQTDSDWAGDKKCRRSITGGNIMLGGAYIKSWSKEQSHTALSSGEAELYAANYGAAQALGVQTMMAEFGWHTSIELQVDANATIGMLHRHGFGKVRHVQVQDLWLQQKVRSKQIILRKVAGTENAADIGTKPLCSVAIEKFLKMLSFSTM